MLKRIEIRNFESHKHTVIEDLSDGISLIRGESNCGKTGIIRALKLAAYNEFDPRSLRVDEAKCEVIVDTDKGRVRVVRGPKINMWEVTPLGQPPLVFDKVGKQVVPEAAKIVGLNVVRLGDVDIPVNIMDQLESHFMLASIGNQDASGSIRAQVIDEISGLSGIEGVIKDVSLDNHRLGREVREIEEQMEQTRSQLHDEQSLQIEDSLLAEVERILNESEAYAKEAESAGEYLSCYQSILAEIVETKKQLGFLPDMNKVTSLIEKAGEMISDLNLMTKLHNEWFSVSLHVVALTKQIHSMPDTKILARLIRACEESLSKVTAMVQLLTDYQKITYSIRKSVSQLEKMKYLDSASRCLEVANEFVVKKRRAIDLFDAISAVKKSITSIISQMNILNAEMVKVVKEKDEILAAIKTCPITLGPISEECLRKAKV